MREQQLKKKNEARQKELGEFNDKVNDKNDLHSQLLALDKKTKAKTQISQALGNDQGADELQESPEVDRRLALMRKMRAEIAQEESNKASSPEKSAIEARAEEVAKRIQKLEEIKR